MNLSQVGPVDGQTYQKGGKDKNMASTISTTLHQKSNNDGDKVNHVFECYGSA